MSVIEKYVIFEFSIFCSENIFDSSQILFSLSGLIQQIQIDDFSLFFSEDRL